MIKSKNKIARRIVLSTLTFSSLLGVGLSLNFINSIDLNEESLVNSNEINNFEEESVPSTKATATAIVRKSGVNFSNYYPFEVIPDIKLDTPILPDDDFWNFFEIAGNIQPNVSDVTFKVKRVSLDNKTSNTQSGIFSLTGEMSRWTDGTNISNSPTDFTIRVTGMRSVTDRTIVVHNTLERPKGDEEYASDNLKESSLNPVRFITTTNGISSRVNPDFDTTIAAGSDITFDNSNGSLTIPGIITNYVDVNGNYVKSPSTQRVTINGFKRIDGPTEFKATENARLSRPSIIFETSNSGVLNESLQEQFFGKLLNPLTVKNTSGLLVPNTKVVNNGFVVSEPNDTEGTIKVTLTVTGGYYGYDNQNRLVPITPNSPSDTQTFSFIVGDIGKFVEKVDNTLTIVIAGIGGGVAFIAILVALIFFIRFQKKKNEEVRKKKSMEDKLYSMSSKPKKGPETSNSVGMAPGGGMAPGMGPGSAPGKYVPPTISVPKSNAPVVKRPSGPVPPAPPTKK